MTQKQRVLRALERAGSTGITSLDFDAGRVIDDGKPIRRVAARVNELRDEGYRILSRTKNGICTYVLVPSAEPIEGSVLTSSQASAGVVVAADVTGETADWSTESLAMAAPVSGRAPESPSEGYLEEELLWV